GVCKCTAQSCANGCCNGDTCILGTSQFQCGGGGAACMNCGAGADTCTNGVCKCGNNAACPLGQTCNLGACAPTPCNAMTCPNGCCDGNTCTQPSPAKCGSGGSICLDCAVRADACTNGMCRCGNA